MKIDFFRRYYSTFTRRRIFLFFAAGVLFIVLFFPFQVTMPLPGEIRYDREDRLITRESAYVVRSPGESSRFFRKGETIFVFDDPFLRFARERVEYMLNFDRILFEQQRSSRETIGDSLLTQRKISSDHHAANELERKMAEGKKIAGRDMVFIPSIANISPGCFLRPGVELGKMCSGEKIVRAYADDQQIRLLKPGMTATLLVKDRVRSLRGKIVRVYQIPFYLKKSPALQSLGGDLPVDGEASDVENMHSLYPVYAVDIVPQKKIIYQPGRYILAKVQYRVMPGRKIWQFIVSVLKREFF